MTPSSCPFLFSDLQLFLDPYFIRKNFLNQGIRRVTFEQRSINGNVWSSWKCFSSHRMEISLFALTAEIGEVSKSSSLLPFCRTFILHTLTRRMVILSESPKGCTCNGDCCPTEPMNREIQIDFLYLDLKTCTRCQGAETNLDQAIREVAPVLRSAGYTIHVRSICISTPELPRSIVSKFAYPAVKRPWHWSDGHGNAMQRLRRSLWRDSGLPYMELPRDWTCFTA